MLDLEKLQAKLDLALSLETEESLTNWLHTLSTREFSEVNKPFKISEFKWEGATSACISASIEVTSLIHIDQIKNFKGITYLQNGEATLQSQHFDLPPNRREDLIFENIKTPNFSESFFFAKITL